MRIAHLLPYSARFPLKAHNGRYEWALRLARLQAGGGHEVTVYSSPGSSDKSGIIWKSQPHDFGSQRLNNLALIKNAFGGQHDIFHSHFDYLHYFLADSTGKPVIFTQHWFPDQTIGAAAKLNKHQNAWAVPASKMMLEENQKLGIASTAVVRQGIDLDLFKPAKKPANARLVFAGRIAPWKGVLEAVQIARSAKIGLDIIGKLNKTEQAYWDKIRPLVDGEQIRYLGPLDQAETAKYLADAKALLFPSQAPEAAPQVPIEAQACGTPVIISNVGATDEWVDNGKTGFICRTPQEFKQAIGRLDTIDRPACRRFAGQFDIADLAENYYRLYEQLLSQRRH